MKRNLKVTTAMTAALAVFVVLFAVAAAAGIAVLRDNRAQIEALGRGSIERAGDLAETTGRLFQARAALTDAKTAMESGMQEARDAHLAQAQALLAQAAAGAGRLRANPDGDPDGGPLFDRVLAAYGRFADGALAPLHKAIQGWNGIEASRIVEQALAPAGAAYVQSADAYQVHARQRGEAAVAGAGRALERVILAAAGLLGVAALLAVLIRLALRRSVLRPLNEAGAHFDRIADGDLTAAIAARGHNEIGVLYSAMRRMRSGLTAAVAAVRRGVEELHAGAGEIAAGGAEMSERAARQAGSVQEALASLTQLEEAVQRTAGDAGQASAQAASAADLARRGAEAVADVARCMEDIAQSARRIGEIVGVVDSIAFQTNILALNAGVEAARAGAHGKGFAVVAGEVRTLAQRSAQAAREIRQLIEESGARVRAGVRQVGLAGQTMAGMREAADSVTRIVDGISLSAAQQADGIVSVNGAVSEIERATQENAAMAEQTAAAAAALESQARRVREAVAVFRIGAAESGGERAGVGLADEGKIGVLDLVLDVRGGRGDVLGADAAA